MSQTNSIGLPEGNFRHTRLSSPTKICSEKSSTGICVSYYGWVTELRELGESRTAVRFLIRELLNLPCRCPCDIKSMDSEQRSYYASLLSGVTPVTPSKKKEDSIAPSTSG